MSALDLVSLSRTLVCVYTAPDPARVGAYGPREAHYRRLPQGRDLQAYSCLDWLPSASADIAGRGQGQPIALQKRMTRSWPNY